MIECHPKSVMAKCLVRCKELGRDPEIVTVPEGRPLREKSKNWEYTWFNLEVFPECEKRKLYAPPASHDTLLRAYDDDGEVYFEVSCEEAVLDDLTYGWMDQFGVTTTTVHDLKTGEYLDSIG